MPDVIYVTPGLGPLSSDYDYIEVNGECYARVGPSSESVDTDDGDVGGDENCANCQCETDCDDCPESLGFKITGTLGHNGEIGLGYDVLCKWLDQATLTNADEEHMYYLNAAGDGSYNNGGDIATADLDCRGGFWYLTVRTCIDDINHTAAYLTFRKRAGGDCPPRDTYPGMPWDLVSLDWGDCAGSETTTGISGTMY